MTTYIRVESQFRLRAERKYLEVAGCETCVHGCGCKLNDKGCRHYACLASPAAIADSCSAAQFAITNALSETSHA
jgi:hypothetical protein